MILLWGCFGLNLVWATNPNGDLEIQLLSASNLIVAQDDKGPELVYLGAKITNRGDNPLTELSVSIGDFDAGTAGIYPTRQHTGLSGSLALTHLGPSDAFRYIGELGPGESTVQYWLVEYPRTDQNGLSVSLTDAIDDDLWLEYDVWANAKDAGADLLANTSQSLHFRSQARKSDIQTRALGVEDIPSEYTDFLQSVVSENSSNTPSATAGQKIIIPVWYQLGDVNEGFDGNGDFLPDFNASLQPVGRLATFDPHCFRLINSSGALLLKDASGNLSFTALNNQTHLSNISRENTAAMALVNYEFLVIGKDCEASLSPYQSVAKQLEEERFNQNFGSPVGNLVGLAQQFSLQANTPDSLLLGSVLPIQYQLSHTSPNPLGVPRVAAGISLSVKIPDGTSFVEGSASGEQAVLYSINDGATWLN
ncbi:MAG: hypothetical protein AAFN10_28580 [Bacteroidota bacterium]